MDRVHGEVIVRRRNNIEEKSDYHDYKDDLVKDFKNICGYCGKNRKFFYDKFEIDHFIPQKNIHNLKTIIII